MPNLRPWAWTQSASGLNPAPFAADGKRFAAGIRLPFASHTYLRASTFSWKASCAYQPSSMTAYCQPYCLRPASTFALSRYWASSMVSPYASQLFQPSGGVGATDCAAALMERLTATTRADNHAVRSMTKHIAHPLGAWLGTLNLDFRKPLRADHHQNRAYHH